MNLLDIAWLAGIIDGEGTVVRHVKKAVNTGRPRDYVTPQLRVAMCDKEAIEKAARIMKCAVVHCFTSQKKDCWIAQQYGRRAVATMLTIWPLLTVPKKKTRILEYVSEWKTIPAS